MLLAAADRQLTTIGRNGTGRAVLRVQLPLMARPVSPADWAWHALPLNLPPSTGVTPLSESLATTWNALPGTRRELQAIADAVGANRLTTFTGPDASKTNLMRLDRPRILHLATHAFYVPRPTVLVLEADSSHPMKIGTSADFRTGFVLAGANERRHLPDSSADDGILTAHEIGMVLDLSGTELVVLSACETAVGDPHFGDSVHGLRRACHTAGAHAVIAGLWSVTDASSAQLMSALYVQLASMASPGVALHEATLDMLRRARASGRTPHPHSWAAFVVSGSIQAVLRPAFGDANRPTTDASQDHGWQRAFPTSCSTGRPPPHPADTCWCGQRPGRA